MAEPASQARPAKCARCDRPLDSVVVCDTCKALQPAPAASDYFSLLGLPVRYDLDPKQIQQRFVALNRHVHPDFHGDESPEVQRLSLQIAAAVNDAYRTLQDPAARAGYLLEILGGRSSAEDKSVPDGFLNSMMMLQEEIADARADGNEAELKRLATALSRQHEGLLRRIASLFAEFDEQVGCTGLSQQRLDEIRRQVNAVSYVRKLLSQLPSTKGASA